MSTRRNFNFGLAAAATAVIAQIPVSYAAPVENFEPASPMFPVVNVGHHAYFRMQCREASGDVSRYTSLRYMLFTADDRGMKIGDVMACEEFYKEHVKIMRYDAKPDDLHFQLGLRLAMARCTNRIAAACLRGIGNNVLVHPDSAHLLGGDYPMKPTMHLRDHMARNELLLFYSGDNADGTILDSPGFIKDGELLLNPGFADDFTSNFNYGYRLIWQA